MAQEPKSQRTERPTPKRLKKAREKGQVARSKDVPGVFVLIAFLVFVHLLGPAWLDRLLEFIRAFATIPVSGEFNDVQAAALFREVSWATFMLLSGPLGFLTAAGLAGNLVQGTPSFTLKPLTPKFDKLNPVQGLKKVISLKNWVEMLKGVLKMVLYGVVAYTAVRDVVFGGPIAAPGVEGTLKTLFALTNKVLLRGMMLAAGLAVLDWLFRRYDHTRTLKMTKREVKDEHKETEGDPLIRSRVRQKQMALARSRMMADVSKATVVVTNPTHYAVALYYVPGESGAPRVLAKGRALLAQRIREIAAKHRVPIVSDPPLARALYRSVSVGAEIPEVLFRAVAEVLALVMPRGRRRRTAAVGTEARS